MGGLPPLRLSRKLASLAATTTTPLAAASRAWTSGFSQDVDFTSVFPRILNELPATQ